MEKRITLLHPSRGRPEKAYRTAREWIDRAGVDVEYILSLDYSDDLESYMEASKFIFNRALGKNYCFINDNKSVVEATNNATQHSSGDILIYLSDDFKCPKDWGQLIIKEFEGVTEPMLLKVDDCLQRFDAPVLTIPIMNRALYKKLGYFWHPEYKSMWVDCDLYETCKRIGAIKYAKHLKFPHEHHSVNKAENDETYKRSESNWNQGIEVFNRRKKQGFPI